VTAEHAGYAAGAERVSADPAQRLVVVGAGGMGRCILDVIDAMNRAASASGPAPLRVVGVVADDEPVDDLLQRREVRFLGPLPLIDRLPPDVGYVIGIGAPAARARIDALLSRSGRTSPVVVHPNVHLGHDVRLAPGAVICSHVSIEGNVRLGRHAHVNQNSTIGHDSVVEPYATISPMVSVSGAVLVGAGAFVGAGASIRQGLTLGAGSTVGMGAAVVRDVAPDVTVTGVPARPRT